MQTVFDWITVVFFAGLIVVMLQSSTGDEHPRVPLWHFAPPALGCAVTNYLGNHGQAVFACLIFVASILYALYYLKPFARR